MQVAPYSGRQIEVSYGDQRAVIVEVGGGLRSYSVAGEDVLDGYAVDEMCTGGRGQPLVPWPNRLDGGVYDFDGERHQLPLSEPSTRTAIHGLTRWANWEVASHRAAEVVMAHRLHPQPGYPFLLDLRLTYSLGADGLAVTCSAHNRGVKPCPYGTGAHPYLRIGPGLVDPLVLHSPAASVLTADERGIPTGRAAVDGTPGDFRTPRPIGDVHLDTAFTDLARGDDGRAVVTLRSPSSSRQISLWVDPSYDYLMLFTGDTLAPARRRRGLAVEPMTCAPNAFNSGDGLVVLDPDQTHECTWGIGVTGA